MFRIGVEEALPTRVSHESPRSSLMECGRGLPWTTREWLEPTWDTIRDPRRVQEVSRPHPSKKGRVLLDPSRV
ncbi:hypothetical protein CRG98_046674 [Punica granatum]|uniref:Uncharacterized protein n=1 Tax=Punica granatum TaxID=22663 RepID=A0A2I0HMJ6_PUNGR|nr:hypothetical protein CRG98_046674 [Punica granatum]